MDNAEVTTQRETTPSTPGDELREIQEGTPIGESLITSTLKIPVNLLSDYDGDDEEWSWGLSPKVMQLKRKISTTKASKHRKLAGGFRPTSAQGLGEHDDGGLEPDMFLHVLRCVGAENLPPQERTGRQESTVIPKPPILKPEKNFTLDPLTAFGPRQNITTAEGIKGGPRAVVVRREVQAPPSAVKPPTLLPQNHTKTLVLRTENDKKAPQLALLKQLDTATKPAFSQRQKVEEVIVSAPKKFKRKPFIIKDLSQKQRTSILAIPTEGNSKLAALQRRLKYDARKYARCKVKTGSSTSESSEEEEEEEEESSENETPLPRGSKLVKKKTTRHAPSDAKARLTWNKNVSNMMSEARTVSVLEDQLSEADKSIVYSMSTTADLEPESQITPSSTPAALPSYQEPQGEDFSSDVSVTAEDLEQFDRWVAAGSQLSQYTQAAEQSDTGSEELPQMPESPVRAVQTPTSDEKGYDIDETEDKELIEKEEEDEEELSEEIEEEGELDLEQQSGTPDLFAPSPSFAESIVAALEQDLHYTEPTFEDVLNVTGKPLSGLVRDEAEKEPTALHKPQEMKLLSTWAPDQDSAQHYSIHHFCTMAIQPQLPRILHNLTRDTHTKIEPDKSTVQIDPCPSQITLAWFEDDVSDPGASSVFHESVKEEEIALKGQKIPYYSEDKKLYWTPAPPKMDLPPLFVRSHLFPKYESAMASSAQRELLKTEETSDSPTSDEETQSEETDEDDRAMRRRILNRRHNSVTDLQKELGLKLTKVGPDNIQERSFSIKRPGSAPVLEETEPPMKFKSDYYTAYSGLEKYQGYMERVKQKTVPATLPPPSQPQSQPCDEKTKMLFPYVKSPISIAGTHTLSPSYTKLLPIAQVKAAKIKVTKQQICEVKESLLECARPLKRSTSTPNITEAPILRERADSCNDLSTTDVQWSTYKAAKEGLKKCYLPVFAHKLGTMLSKDILQLHQIIKKEEPTLYSDVLNEIHRLSTEISKGGPYVHYNRSRRGGLYVKIGMLKEAKMDLDLVVGAMPKMADAYWHRHLIYVLQGDSNTALNDLTNIIRHSQRQSRVYLARAEIYRGQGDITGAILNYSQALKLDKNNAETYYKRADLFEEKGDILLALEDYTMANKLCPSNTIAILKKGRYNFKRGAYSVAVADFSGMLEQEPYNSVARTFRGRAYAKMGKYSNALEDLSCAIHINPDYYLPFYHRAVLLRQEDPKRALQDFSVSIMLNPRGDNKLAFLHRGILYTELQRYEEAVPDFEATIDLDPYLVDAHINLGLICMTFLRQYKRAIRCFTGAIEVDPINDRAFICRGDGYKHIKQLNKALIDYTRAIHIRPDIARYYIYRGKLLLEMGHLDQASKHIKFASVLNTSSMGTSALQKAVVQSFLHNFEDAILILDRAAGLDPSASQYILLGKTYLKAKHYSDAVDNFEKALLYLRRCRSTMIPFEQDLRQDLHNLEKNPKILKQEMPEKAAEVYFLIGKCHVESGNYTSALDALNSAIRINPNYAEAYFQRGLVRIWVKSQRPLLDFNRALAYNPNFFQAYLTRAAYFGLKGRYSKAIFNCNEAIRIQPNSVRAYLYRGSLKYEIKNYDLAIVDLTSAIVLDSLCSLAYYNRAVSYQQLNQTRLALRDYGIVLMLEKEQNQKVLLNRGLLYYQSGDYDNALVDFKAAVKDSPDNALLYHTLGLCYHRNHQLDDALKTLTHAMKLKEHFLQAYISRGNVHLCLNTELGNIMSKRDYCRALHHDPTLLQAHVNLGIGLQSHLRMYEAWKQFTAAIQIDPTCYAALEARSIVNLQMGHLFGAFCDINTAVKLCPTSTMLTNRGVIQQFMKDSSNAMRDFQQAIEADPTYSLAHFNAANLYFNMRQFDNALKHFNEAVRHDNQDEGAVLNRAITKVLVKDYDGALVDFETAIAANPHAAHAYFNRGNLHLSMGNFELAEADYRTALTLQPNDSSTYNQLAVTLGRQFRQKEALDNYKHAIKLNSHKGTSVGQASRGVRVT